jgi:hypothetical protein
MHKPLPVKTGRGFMIGAQIGMMHGALSLTFTFRITNRFNAKPNRHDRTQRQEF